jgi:Domain of unknown function (DUF1707)
MSTYRGMRASDEDREEATAVLSDAFATGRLTPDELDERCTAAFAAKTRGELDDLTADLPVVRVAVSPLSGAVAASGARRSANPKPSWLLLRFALILGGILLSLTGSSVAWTGVPLMLLALMPPLALRIASRRRR